MTGQCLAYVKHLKSGETFYLQILQMVPGKFLVYRLDQTQTRAVLEQDQEAIDRFLIKQAGEYEQATIQISTDKTATNLEQIKAGTLIVIGKSTYRVMRVVSLQN